MHVSALLCPFWEAHSKHHPICKQNSYRKAEETEPEARLAKTVPAPLMPTKAVLVYAI